MMLERFGLKDRRAVVTGGGRGLGRVIASTLADAGAEVVVLDLDGGAAESVGAELTSAGHVAHAFAIDVTKQDDVEALQRRIESEIGEVDVLVNNAGIVIVKDALETSGDEWRRTMNVNVNAMFYCSQSFGRAMVARGRGAIVNIGSLCGIVSTVPQNTPSYIASKGAVHMLTKSLATGWAKSGVRVNAVAPAYLETEMTTPFRAEKPDWFERWESMTPMGRLGGLEEVASAVLFLASDAASYTTGAILSVDGGYTAL